MATNVHGRNARIYCNTWDISGYANSWQLTIDRDTAETTVFTDSAKTFIAGDYSWTLNVTSLFDATNAGYSETVLYDWANTAGTTPVYTALCPQGATADTTVYEAYGIFNSVPLTASTGDVIGHSFTMQGTGNLGRGKILYVGSISATGTQDSVDFNAATAAGTQTAVIYRVLSVTGAGGNVVFATEESSDDGSGDAFAAVADYASGNVSDAAISLTRKSSTGAVERYLRLNTTTLDATSITALVTRVTHPPLGI